MMRTITLLLLLAVGARSYAQATLQQADRSAPDQGAGALRAAGDTVFHEDFANGLQGNNGVGPWSRGAVGGSIWKFDTDGPGGAYSSSSETITSTTASNGFMIFDTDRANSDTTATPPSPLLPATAWDGYLISPVLDLTAFPEVHLTFQMRTRWCCNPSPGHFVDVSTDGGATWPTRFNVVQQGHATNQDPGTYSVDLDLRPTVLPAPGLVRFRFVWAGSGLGNSHYHWQVDDVALTVSPDVGMPEPGTTALDLSVAPSPCDDHAMVRTGDGRDGPLDWTVTDASGREVLAGRSGTGVFELATARLAPGPYTLRVSGGGAARTMRFAVAH